MSLNILLGYFNCFIYLKTLSYNKSDHVILCSHSEAFCLVYVQNAHQSLLFILSFFLLVNLFFSTTHILFYC